MPRTRLVLLATVLALPLLTATAFAESQTVRGTGDLKKMVANNGRSAVNVQLFGFKKPCEARQFNIHLEWSTKAYEVQAGCIGGQKWMSGLFYNPNRADGLGQQKVRCRGFSLKYSATTKSWRAIVPRSCISKAPGRIRVRAEGINYTGSAMPAEARTKFLRRG